MMSAEIELAFGIILGFEIGFLLGVVYAVRRIIRQSGIKIGRHRR